MTHLTVLWLALAAIRGLGGSLPAPMAQQQEVAQAVYAKVAPSVVLIVVEDANGKAISQGSGFVIEGSLIVTNAHVIRGGAAFVYTGVAKVPCMLTRIDERVDLAVLRTAVPLTALALRAADENTPIGTRVFALGNPQGLERTITEGLYTGPRTFDGIRLLQISAPISPGSSGGPVVDSNGLVVGIAVSSLEAGQNLNFAVPVDTLIALLAQPEIAQAPAPPAAVPPPPPSRNAAAETVASRLAQFDSVLAQRLAIRISKETMPQWLELRQRERDFLDAAAEASRTDEDLMAVHSAATNGHHDIALDAAKLALQRTSSPAAWHYFGIAASGLALSEAVDDPRKTELLHEAKAAVQKAVQMHGAAKGWLLAGSIHDALHEWGAAQAAFKLAMSIGLEPSDRPAALRGSWRAAGGLNQTADALMWFGELTRSGGAVDGDLYLQANFLTDIGRYEGAAALYESLAANPRQQTAAAAYLLWYSAAYARWRAGDDARAIAHANAALAAAPEDAASARVRAQAHGVMAAILITRLDPMAVDAGRRSVQADPGFGWGQTQLARALNIAGSPVEAESVARTAVSLTGGNDSESYFALGTALYFQQRWEDSRAAYVRAATLNPKDGHAAFNAGLALEALGRPIEALPWYEEALKRDPAMKERDQVLAAIAKLRGGR